MLNGIGLQLKIPLDLCTNEAALRLAAVHALERCLLLYHLDQAGLSHFIVVLFFVLFLTSIKSINEFWTVDNNDNL